MRIVGYLHFAPPMRVVGGEMMTLRLLNHAAEQGHDVSAVIRELDHESMFGKVKLVAGHTTSNQGALRAFNEAELLVTHPEIADGPPRYTAKITRAPAVGIIHNLGRKNIRGLIHRPNMAVIANSHETARLLIETGATGTRPITVIYPPTEPPAPPVEGLPPAFCTMVNLSAAKGAGVLQHLVTALPATPFLAVLGGHGVQETPTTDTGNVTLYGHFSGMGMPYALSRILISPSRDETYGMVVCEATALGIPVVASDIPAHREALGDSAVYLDPDDIQGWIDAVRTLMTDDGAWQTARRRSLAYAEELRIRESSSYAKWLQLITHLTARPPAQ